MKKLFALLVALFFILSACGMRGGDDNGGPLVTNTFKTYTLTLFMPTPDTMNPLYTKQTTNIKIYDLIYDSLISLDKNLAVMPQLSESCTVSADCKSITFTLKSGITWHDGAPFTSNDVKHTFDLLLKSDYEGPYKHNVSRVLRVETIDDLHFTVYLKSPYARVLNLFTFPIVPAHRTDVDESPCGTGQYMFSEYRERDCMILKKNTLWQLGDVPIEETIKVNILDSTDDITSILNLGEISALTLPATQLPETGIVDTMQQIQFPSLRYEFIGFNLSSIVFSEVSVRQAISAAIDRQRLLDSVYFGKGSAVNCPVHPMAFFYSKDIDNAEYIDEKYSVILKENGWADHDSNGIYDKFFDGEPNPIDADLIVNEDNSFRVNCANKIAETLAECGMKISVKALPFEKYLDKIKSGQYDMFLGGMEFSADFDYTNMLTAYSQRQKTSDKMLEALNRISLAVSSEDIKNAYLNFQYVFADEMPVAGLFFTDDILLCNDKIQGVSVSVPQKPFADINKWHFSNQ